MEAYIKLVGQSYLRGTLQSVVNDIIASDIDLEVDPVRLGSRELLARQRERLGAVVRQIWSRVAASHAHFPEQLQRCFCKIRQYLEYAGKPEVSRSPSIIQ